MKYIYLYRNLINNKKYVGQTNNIERRKKQHRDDSFNNYDCKGYTLKPVETIPGQTGSKMTIDTSI